MRLANSRLTLAGTVVALTLVSTLVVGIAITVLYRSAYQAQLQGMEKEVQTLAALMESVAQFDQRFSARTHPQGSWGATMSQIENALKARDVNRSYEEIYLGRRVGDQLLVTQVAMRQGFKEIARVPFDGRLAQGLYRALHSERGSGEVADYAGRRALAAYAPVPTLGIALLYHVELAQFRAPFLHAALWAAALGLLLVGIAAAALITYSRPLQRRLIESERRSTARIAAAPVGVYETDAAGHCIYVNDRWCDLAGMAHRDALGDGWIRALHLDDAATVYAAWQEFVARRAPFDLEYRFLRPNGEVRWLSGQAVAMTDASGEVTGFTGTITDITGLKLAQSRFNEAERLAKVGSWELDLLTNHLLWSDEIFRIFEIDQSKFGATYEAFLNAIHPDDRDAVNKAYTGSLADREPYEIVHRLKMADGRIKYVRETGESYFDAAGKPLRSVGTVQDISDLHRAELELRQHREHLEELIAERTARLAESERQLRRAQEIARLGHWSVNLVSGELYWSDEIYRIFGRDPAHFQPSYENFFACVHPDDHARVKASEQDSFRSGRHSVDHRVLWTDGSVRWVHEEAQLERDADGKPLRLTGTVQDITERIQAEAELINARNAAERANQAKSDFLSRMSHELRTPLNAILGFAQVLEMDRLKPEQREFVHEIHRAGDHLLELINELLDLSRIEAGKMVAVLKPVNVKAAAADAARIIQPLLKEMNITLTSKCSDQATVLADSTRLKQVLVNLLSNAAKYNRTGGRVNISCQPSGFGRQRIAVTDTGPGIAPEKLGNLFKPFERLGAEFSAVDGTGVGLALSKQLTELMGGTLGLDSTPGEGATFWIDLADASGQSPEVRHVPDQESTAISATSQLKVLYVEDNAANLRVVEAMFRHQPQLRLLTATNGEFGLDLARRYRPDVILLDIHLPGMDGYAVLDALRADAATRAIPVIALTADAMPIDIETGLKAGFCSYLTKPVKMETLLETLYTSQNSQRVRAK